MLSYFIFNVFPQIMCENIDNLLERGEKIELLVDKTDKLSQTAFKFEKSSRALKRSVYCNRIRMYLLVFFVIAVSVAYLTEFTRY